MNLREGAAVYTADGDKVGSLDRVVLDPRSKEVTHIVVKKGLLFREDKVVPVGLVGTVSEGDHINLRPDAGDLELLPNFEESQYVAPGIHSTPRAYEGSPLYWYPPAGTATWTGQGIGEYAGVQYVRETTRNIPEGTVALKKGAEVLANDDKTVGTVTEVLTEPEADRATHVIIAEGIILKEKKLVPTSWITSVLEDQILLAVPSEVVKSLPEYETQT